MPHVNIRHFPKSFTKEQEETLVAEISGAVSRCFQCELDVISIALEPVEPNDWKARIYDPEIIGRSELLCKTVNY